MKALIIAPIRFYRRWISPAIPARCRYYPSCSTYAVTALTRHGAIRGTALAFYRLARCHPWSLGGVDHVPEKGRFEGRRINTPQSSNRVSAMLVSERV
jgi:uncharacterized protein